MLPEWAPNFHPLIVHFPIALLVVAVPIDIASLALPRMRWLQGAATGLYCMGALAALAAFFSGREAVESVLLPLAANKVLSEHADWGLRAAWLYGIVALLRAGWTWHKHTLTPRVHLLFVCLGIGGLYVLYETGDHGAQLVYQYGVGVAAVDSAERKPHRYGSREEGEEHGEHGKHDEGTAQQRAEGDTGDGLSGALSNAPLTQAQVESELHVATNGDWRWDVGPYAAAILSDRFTWLVGDGLALKSGVQRSAKGDSWLSLMPQGVPAFFVYEQDIGSVQIDLRVDLHAFNGGLRVVHNVQSADDYYFLELKGSEIRLGNVRSGAVEIFDEGAVAASDWMHLRLVSHGTHFRGYVNEKMVVHGHAKAPAPGRVGLRLEGTGSILLDDFHTEQIK